MQTDIITAILFTAVLCFILGFFACAICASRRIREERTVCYWEGYGACNRERQQKQSAMLH